MPITPDEARTALAQADVLHTEQALMAALDRMAAEITAQLEHSNPLVLCVMIGGLIPAGHLLTRLRFPLQLDYIHATRYRGQTSGGELHWRVRPHGSLAGRVVLLIDDILDEGHTLAAIVKDCYAQGAKEVLTAVALVKEHGRGHAMQANFSGLTVNDRYVFGFGMDYKEFWRTLPAIYAVNENA